MKILLYLKSKDYTYGGPAHVCRTFKFLLEKKQNTNLSISIWDDNDIKSLNNNELEDKISDYDLVSIHGIWSFKNSKIAKICRKCLVPYVISLHGMLDPWSWKKNFFFKIIFFYFFLKKDFKYASLVHCLNIFELDLAKKFLQNKNICIFENLLDHKNYILNHKFYNQKKIGDLQLLYFGRITKKKGLEKFLNSISTVKKKFVLKIVGPANTKEDIKYLNKLKFLTNKLGLNSRVKFYDPISQDKEKSKIINEANIFVLPSLQEGDSVALKESVLHGLPLLITKDCKFNVSFDNKQFGYYLDNKLSNAKEIIEELIDMDDIKYKKLSDNAVEYSENFKITNEKINLLNSIFEDIIRSKKNYNFKRIY